MGYHILNSKGEICGWTETPFEPTEGQRLIDEKDYHPDPRAALAAAKTAKLHAAAEAAQARRSQVRTVDRSERIRTYNFPENRIADHRTGFKAYNLDAVLDGDLGPVIASAIAMDEAERLSQVGEGSGS